MRKNNTTEAHNRQRMLEYGRKHGGTKAALRFRCSRKTYYKWLKVWDGTWQSLQDRSRAPKTHPRKIDDETINKIRKRLKQFRWTDLLMAYQVSRKLWSFQKDSVTAKRRKAKEKEEADTKAVQEGRVSGAEGADRCKVRSCDVRNQRKEVLSIHRSRRMYALDIPRNVR